MVSTRAIESRTYVLKLLLVLTILFVVTCWLIQQTDVRRPSVRFFEPDFFTAKPIQSYIPSEDFLVNTEGCRIPAMDPFDPSIRRFIITGDDVDENDSEGPIKCAPPGQEPYLSPLVSSNLTHIFIEDKSIIERNLSSPPACCYEPFWRKTFNVSLINVTKLHDVDSQFERRRTCIDFQTSAFMGKNEFVKVECYQAGGNKSDNEIIYKDFFAFTPVKRKNKTRNNYSTEGPGGTEDGFSVLIVGVDAVSRLNLYRQMPKTVHYIKNRLKGVEMLGYNKVADNTFPNLVPVLSGFSVEELKSICWPTDNNFFDDCPFLWKQFSQAGYTTLFAEDATWMGIFNYVKRGFFNPPTDYYWGPFNKRAEKEIGSEKRLNAHICTGYRKTLQTLLDYGKKFALSMSKERYFGLIWGTSLSHDYLNLPRYGDEDHVNFLRMLVEKGALNNTILVFMSDHGIRWGGIRSTYQGHVEERLPFLYFVFPEKFKKKYSTALGYLHMNTRRLTTPFDLHETLLDLLHSSDRLSKHAIKKRIQAALMSNYTTKLTAAEVKKRKRGVSLFLPVPTNRTCEDAGIPNHWCTCHQTTEVSVNNTVVTKAAEHVIDHINNLLSTEMSRCAKLTLKRLLSARVEQTLPHIGEGTDSSELEWLKDYTITMEAIPGNGNFEATVRRHSNGLFRVMGTVSRTNVYGNQSACVTNYRLKLYCYCYS